MNFEKPETTPPSKKEPGEKLIESEPKLRYIYKSLELLKSERGPTGEEINWRELHAKVKPFENALELSDNIREVVTDYIAQKIPTLKEKIPTIKNLPDKDLIEALTNNWFEKISEETEGERREVLLAVMAHVVRRIETGIYKKILENASEEDLQKMNLKNGTRGLLIELLDASAKADPLFIRFLAMSQLSPKPPKEAKPLSIFLPADNKFHTLASLFPHETQFISKKLTAILENSEAWINEPSAEIFKEYLKMLSGLYSETDTEKAAEIQRQADSLYEKLVSSGFPIIVTSGTEGYYKEPYIDPELKISLRTPEAEKEREDFKRAQRVLAENLSVLNVSQFAENLKKREILNTVVCGAYGVNLVFNAVAQEKPAILIYLNEQLRAYDRNFPKFLEIFTNTAEEFTDLPEEERENLMEQMSRFNTVLHEFSHEVHPDGSPGAQRIGKEPLTIIDEVKADIIYRPLVPNLIESGALKGTKEEWAIAMVASSLQVIKDTSAKDDPYYAAAAFSLNDLFEKGIVVFENDKLTIKDFDSYYQIQESLAKEVIALYEDEKMTETKASKWFKKRCYPNGIIQKIDSFLKQN